MTINIQNMFLTPNEWSRPQIPIKQIRGIVIHWVANPGTSAKGNRDFFESRKAGTKDYGSAHYIVGQEGEVILCMPESEMAYHVGSKTYTQDCLNRLGTYANDCTIGIECCHIDWNGLMTAKTYNSALELAVQLLYKYGLTENDLWLHKEVVGWKDCHFWFVKNPKEWTKFKALAGQKLKELRAPKEELKVLDKWQYDLGMSAVDALGKLGLLNDPETWKKEDKLAQPVPTWLFFEMIRRLKESK